MKKLVEELKMAIKLLIRKPRKLEVLEDNTEFEWFDRNLKHNVERCRAETSVGCETNLLNVASLLDLKFVNLKTTGYIPLFKLKGLYSTRCSIKPNMSSFRG